MLEIYRYLNQKNVPDIDNTVSQMTKDIQFCDGKSLSHNPVHVVNALDKLAPFVDFTQDSYGQDYLITPIVCPFTYEPKVVVELSFNGILRTLMRKNILNTCHYCLVFENDVFEIDFMTQNFKYKASKGDRGELVAGFVSAKLCNKQIISAFMNASELQGCYDVAREQKYGNRFPHADATSFFLASVIRRALNNHIDILMSMGDDAEIFVRQLAALSNDYYRDFERLHGESLHKQNMQKNSKFISKEVSKTERFMNKNNATPRSSNVVQLNVQSTRQNVAVDETFTNGW